MKITREELFQNTLNFHQPEINRILGLMKEASLKGEKSIEIVQPHSIVMAYFKTDYNCFSFYLDDNNNTIWKFTISWI